MSWLRPPFPERVHVAAHGLTFVPLTPALLEQDYTAVMHDVPMLRAWSGQDWPTADFTREEDLADLVRHDEEQQRGIALTYSVLVGEADRDATVQGCVYVRPFLDAMRTRDVEPPDPMAVAPSDAVARGWAHDVPAEALIAGTLQLLATAPLSFPRCWWQTNTDCPDQLAACDRLGLTGERRFPAVQRTWVLRTVPA